MTLTAHVRFLRYGLAAAVLAGSGVAAAPVQAESIFGMNSPDIGQPSVAVSVMRQGYVVRSAIVRRGDVYVCDVSDARGGMERLVIDGRTGRVMQRYPFRAVAYVAEPHRFAPAVGGGGLFTSPPRPYVDVPQPRPQIVEVYPDSEEPLRVHHRDLAYGGGRDPLASPPIPVQPKPVERPKPKTARPKPVWTAPSSAKPSETAAVPATAKPNETVGVPATADPTPTGATAPIEPAKASPAVAAAPARSEPAKPVVVAPAKTEGVVASSAPAAIAPAPLPKAAAPAPVAAPAPSKPKAINDIPVAPLD